MAIYRGASFRDVHVYADFGNGERQPTRKGLTIALRHIDEVVASLEQAKIDAALLGLLPDVRGTDDLGDAR